MAADEAPFHPMRLLFVSNLFPDAAEPIRGLDNALVLEALASLPGFEVRALSPRPEGRRWFGGTGRERRAAPREHALDSAYVAVRHLPKLGGLANAELMRRDLRRAFREACEALRPEAVLCSWLFPDGCAVAELCEEARLPLVLVAQGSDVHRYLGSPPRRRRILGAVASARATICRSGDLAKRLEAAGADPAGLRVVYNGVDREVFRLRGRAECREGLGIAEEGPLLLYVGNLLPVKDPLFLLRAVAEWNVRRSRRGLAPGRLAMLGEGPLRAPLEREIARLGASSWATLPGRRSPEEIARWMGAADLLCLSSRNEGFPNVILEAMACGLPVVSTDVGGIGEKVGGEAAGRLVPPGDREAYVAALDGELAEDRRGAGGTAVRSWPETAEAYAGILAEAVR